MIMATLDCKENNDNSEIYLENCSINVTLDEPLTKDALPVYSIMEDTADVADKNCIICPKKNMNLLNLVLHYSGKHQLILSDDEDDCSPLDEWIQAKENVNESNLEFMVADIEEENNYNTHSSSSYSSSESSSESESQPQRHRKKSQRRSKTSKHSDEMKTEIEVTKAKIEQTND